MMKLKHVAFAGITALAFSPIAFAGGGYDKQGQSGMSEPSARQEQPQQQSTAPGVEQSTIKQAQEKLNVEADGVLGPKTQAALKEFQQKEGIQASGRLDQETLAKLGVDESSAGTGSSSPASEAPSPQSSADPTTDPQS
jgi:peptidoglycan hydrolase-like protein with peptidoglycan-binding domain